jgi:hypothetical protein
MTIEPTLQKILQGIPHTEDEKNEIMTGSIKPQEKESQAIRVELI